MIKCLCIIDEQSDSTFCDKRIPAVLNLSPNECSYYLSTMSGLRTQFDGMEITNLEVRGFGEEKWIRLPTTFTHPSIPDTRSEVALPHVVKAHPHTRPYTSFFPKVDPDHDRCCCLLELTVAKQCLLDVIGQRFTLFITPVSVGPSLVLYHATRRILKKMASTHPALRTSFSTTCEHYSSSPAFEESVVNLALPTLIFTLFMLNNS